MNQWLTLKKLQKIFIFVAIISFFKYIKTQSYKFFIIPEFFKNCFKKRLTTAIFLSSLNDRLLTLAMTLPKVDRRLVNGLKSRTFSRSSSFTKRFVFLTNFVFHVWPFQRYVAWLRKKRQNGDLRDNVNMDASHNSKLKYINISKLYSIEIAFADSVLWTKCVGFKVEK